MSVVTMAIVVRCLLFRGSLFRLLRSKASALSDRVAGARFKQSA